MKYKKLTCVTGMTALLLILSIVLVFATSAKPAKATENPETPSGNTMETNRSDTATDVPLDPPKGSTEPNAAAPKEEPLSLYKGKGYSILIPTEGWQIYAPDAWLCNSNEQVQVWVNDCSGSTYDQVISHLMADGYSQTESPNLLMKESEGRIFFTQIQESGFIRMCVNYTYPAESESTEEFVTLLHTIADSFAIVSEDNNENLSEDGKQLRQLALSFWEAYLAGNTEAVEQYLAADYSWDIDVFPDGLDGHVAEEAFVQSVKGLDKAEKSPEDTFEIWIEFHPAAGADYVEYLTLEVIKEQDGWKVLSYALEL